MTNQIYIPKQGEKGEFFHYTLENNSIYSIWLDKLTIRKSFARQPVDRISLEDKEVKKINLRSFKGKMVIDMESNRGKKYPLPKLDKQGFYEMLRVVRDYHIFRPSVCEIPEPVCAQVDEYLATSTGSKSPADSPQYFLWIRFKDWIELPERFFQEEKLKRQKRKLTNIAGGVDILSEPIFEPGEIFDRMNTEKYCPRINQLLGE